MDIAREGITATGQIAQTCGFPAAESLPGPSGWPSRAALGLAASGWAAATQAEGLALALRSESFAFALRGGTFALALRGGK